MRARMWPEWAVEYAERGIGDVAEAAGVPRRRVGDPGPEVRPTLSVDVTATVEASGMSAALIEFLDGFTRVHAAEVAHPAIRAMDALESMLGLPAGVLNPAIADHHPLAATADEVADVVAHAGELLAHYLAVESGPANRPDSGMT